LLFNSLPDLCNDSFAWIFILAIFFLPVPVAGIKSLILGLWVK
jgi:hypothetical protein